MFCTNCGHKNPSNANFCSSCGSALQGEDESTTITFVPIDQQGELEEEFQVPITELSHGFGILVIKRGPNPGSRHKLEKEITTVGRHPDSDIFLDDITVSRRHVEFIKTEFGYKIKDVGSLNVTYLNRERIEEAELANSDEIQIGKFKLVFLEATNQ